MAWLLFAIIAGLFHRVFFVKIDIIKAILSPGEQLFKKGKELVGLYTFQEIHFMLLLLHTHVIE